MGQLDEQPENVGSSDPKAAEELLRSMSQDIEKLRQNLLAQLSQDVERLQREKSQLIEDIDKLQAQRKQQLVQQQQLVRQIAPALANQLQDLLTQQLNQLGNPSATSDPQTNQRSGIPEGHIPAPFDSVAGSVLPPNVRASDYNEDAYRLIASLDATLRTTFKTLQQDLSSYQSSLSQQLGQMYSLEQQGEAILETLVSRLRDKIESESLAIQSNPLAPSVTPVPHPPPRRNGRRYPEDDYYSSTVSYPDEQTEPAVPIRSQQEPPAAIPPQPLPKATPASKLRLGFVLVLLYSLVLSFQNVVITVILNQSSLLGFFKLGGFITPSVGNSLLILWLRMLFVVPLMAIVSTALYPSVWRDIRQFAQSKDWPVFTQVVGSGFFLFLSQVLIYLALGPISPGVAITIFFVYPIFTVLLAWVLFGDRPSLFRSSIITTVLFGVVLIMLPTGATKLSGPGVAAAVGSGITFAFYVILTQSCARKLHPIPFSWINFAVILVFSSLSLLFPLPDAWTLDVNPSMWPYLILSCLILGLTTLAGYLLNNIGISMIGAARASIIGSTGPALTALLAWVMIGKALKPLQLFGMLLVTLGVAALSLERLRNQGKSQTKTAQPATRK
jgi:drug/metabolite transporter (DMT)-like permease